jgi:TonB family protein
MADSPAPNKPIPFRQQPAPAISRPPVTEAQLRPAIPAPPVNTEWQLPVAPLTPVQSPKPVNLPYTPPSAIRQLAPIVSDKMRRSITGEVVVRVKVNVDAAGKVIAAETVGGTAIPEALADSTISAVKRWQFEPARRGDVKVPGDIVLSFAFRK